MAKKLKCWKKTIGHSGLPIIYLKRQSFAVRIDKYTDWVTMIETINPRSVLYERNFKSKSQALNSAKSYMRKHDRC